MALSEDWMKDGPRFTFTWKIENFSMCPQQHDEYIASPTFVVDFLDNAELKLHLFPRGFSNERNDRNNYVSCFLKRTEGGNYSQDIWIYFELGAFSLNNENGFTMIGRSLVTELPKEPFYVRARDAILNSKNEFLPNDTLTVRCRIKICAGGPTRRSNDFTKIIECSARTRIKVSKKSILWPIKNLHNLVHKKQLSNITASAISKSPQKLHWIVASSMEDEPSFDITCILTEKPVIKITRKNSNDESKGVFVRCKFETIKAPKIIQQEAEGEHYFPDKGTADIWRFPSFINIKDLTEKEYFFYTNDVLYLQCSFSFSTKGHEFNIENTNKVFHQYPKETEKTNKGRSIGENLFRSGKLSDVSLQVQGRVFAAHKSILSARSDVFCAMFESDMKEKKTGVVNIVDMDPDTVEQLLRYIYTNVLGNLNQEDAIKLYTAAHKYNVMQLKYLCGCKLTANLSVSNVADVWKLADIHHDTELLDDVRHFIRTNINEIFHSQNWKEFSENYKELAADTALRISMMI